MSRSAARDINIEEALDALRRAHVTRPRRIHAHDQRRAEDRIREEYHDARAIVLNARTSSTIVGSVNSPDVANRVFVGVGRMRVRIIKPIPAPVMDGFDLRQLRVNQVFDVDERTGRYLVVAGYAIDVTHAEPNKDTP